jgi:CopG antitoxin of type II toxin-antitoxin system
MTKMKSRIPKFHTLQEEAKFWDTHDTTDFEDKFKPAMVHVAKPLEYVFSVRFDGQTLSELQRQAERKGTGTATLIRMLVKEGLEALHFRQSPA